jgi:Homocysteine/selenocysteine methylase (S-methylmethionine-dependent)
MDFVHSIKARRIMLAEGSVYERLRRHPGITFHPSMRHGVLVYDPAGRKAEAEVHKSYIAAAREAGLPLILLSDTWRANAENIAASVYAGRPVNQDNIALLKALRDDSGHEIFIGGQSGCRGDAYRPDEALDADAAYAFHRPQMQALAEAKPDFLFAATLPAFREARGIARAQAETGLPYLLSFVLRPAGTLLDGTPWADAIKALDDAPHPPLGYAVNCVHPKVLAEALSVLEKHAPDLLARVIFFQANTSPLTPEELTVATDLLTEEPGTLAEQICALQRRYGLPVTGGCCGTDERHIAALGHRLAKSAAQG